jgi:predicted nucleic acid-binding protein
VAAFDFEAARRWARFDPQKTLARRGDDELPFVDAGRMGGQGLLLDTGVYIDQIQDRSPQILDDLIAQRHVNNSTVAIQELMHTVGVLQPSDARTATAVAVIGAQIRAMPQHRTFAPDIEVLGRAALLSGILSRLQGYEKDGKLRALQDCTLFLQAQKLGLAVLTANVRDFDILLQLIPSARALFYRRT